MQIRPSTPTDTPKIAHLREQTIRHVNSKDYSQKTIEDWSSKKNTQNLKDNADTNKRWVAVDKGVIVGFCEHTASCEISRIYVHKDYLRQGVGSGLLEVAENSLIKQGCKKVYIESTTTAKDFYKKNGYKVIKNDFHNQDKKAPIYIMSKNLH
ncbi:GNAT family N-acetyltransferase [Patescibacteria group bacterium]|nr:GNAT family N-acetyltransferase [Patescibacteria group bacterium]